MNKLKYIKQLFEHINNVKVLDVDYMNVTLINPDGDKVTVEMEEDGEWEDWIDPPYVKAVSVSGDDGKYQYSMSAEGDGSSGYEITDLGDIQVESLDDIKKREESKRKASEYHKKQWEENQKRLKEKYKKELEESGLSESDFQKEKRLKEQLSLKYLIELQDTVEDENYALAKVQVFEYDPESGKVDYAYIDRYKVPISDAIDLDEEYWEQTAYLLGIECDPEKLLTAVGIVDNQKGSYFKGIESPTPYKKRDPRNFLDRAPFYANVEYYLKDQELEEDLPF